MADAEALKGKIVTQSGQEPPYTGRRAPDVSGDSIAPHGQKRQNRRRPRKRSRSDHGGEQKTGDMSLAPRDDTPAMTGEGSSISASGPQNGNGAPHPAGIEQRPQANAGSKNRRRRKRARVHNDDAAKTDVSAVGVGDSVSESAKNSATDNPKSAKGRKAANRRGRRRWKAAKSERSTSDVADKKGAQKPVSKDNASGNGHVVPDNREGLEHATDGRRRHGRRNAFARHVDNQESKLYAALDLGTNNCRLLIARPEQRGFRVVDAYSRIVRLGEGIGANRNLSSAAMDRAIDALANCHRKLAERGVSKSRLIATEACRAAENGDDFISRVQKETGLALEVVNRETEARLAVAGCASLVDPDADGVILFDIGGGSSEIVWLDLRNRSGARGYALTRFIRSWISLPVGVVNLAERHGGVHVTPDIFEDMVDDAANHLSGFNLADNLSEAISSGKVHMLGTSGTVTTLAGVHLGLKRYDRRRVDGTWLNDDQVGGMIDHLRDMPYEARVENPCIGADRADLVLAGCAILEAIRRRWTCPRLRVADRGLREGILTELMAADGVWSRKRQNNRPGRNRNRNR